MYLCKSPDRTLCVGNGVKKDFGFDASLLQWHKLFLQCRNEGWQIFGSATITERETVCNALNCRHSSQFLPQGPGAKRAIPPWVLRHFRCWKWVEALGLVSWWKIWHWNWTRMTPTYDNKPIWFYWQLPCKIGSISVYWVIFWAQVLDQS